MTLKVTVDDKKKILIIELPYEDNPRPSSSGKSMIVATTRGSVQTMTKFQGKNLTVGVNVYIPINN